jgi:hypothetical protein
MVLLEQTWGRAVRASHNSQEFGALLICGFFEQMMQVFFSAFRNPLSKLKVGWFTSSWPIPA